MKPNKPLTALKFKILRSNHKCLSKNLIWHFSFFSIKFLKTKNGNNLSFTKQKITNKQTHCLLPLFSLYLFFFSSFFHSLYMKNIKFKFCKRRLPHRNTKEFVKIKFYHKSTLNKRYSISPSLLYCRRPRRIYSLNSKKGLKGKSLLVTKYRFGNKLQSPPLNVIENLRETREETRRDWWKDVYLKISLKICSRAFFDVFGQAFFLFSFIYFLLQSSAYKRVRDLSVKASKKGKKLTTIQVKSISHDCLEAQEE